MAYETGTATSAVDLVNKLNTFLTANGWTKIRGETDIAPASPKAARYWRVLWLESDGTNDDYRGLRALEFRGTPGGANLATDGTKFAFQNLGLGDGPTLAAGTGAARSIDVNDDCWWISYDFGTATSIEEVSMTAETDNYAPAYFHIQWSQDNVSWTTMYTQDYDASLWTANYQTNVFTFASGYLEPIHPSATVCRRSGWSHYLTSSSVRERDVGEQSDDVWCWQGPGYDADRRVYVSAITNYDLTTSDEMITWDMHTEVDTQLPASQWMHSQPGSNNLTSVNKPTHFMSSNGATYWFFCNNTRFIVVTRAGVDDYTSSYLGFLSAFAQPDDYPFPLYMASTATHYISSSLTTATTEFRDMTDPSSGAGWVHGWDGTWRAVQNHEVVSGQTENWVGAPAAWTWPMHVGSAGRSDWPYTATGDNVGGSLGHWLDRIDPTEQGDLPIWPMLVQSVDHGNVGVMTGVYKVPGGGVLAPEATFTIGGDTYHVFATRAYSDGHNYYAIKED